MKAQDIYKSACAILFERPGDDVAFDAFFIPTLNLLLVEALAYENAHRLAGGQSPLELAPQISGMDDEVPYCQALCSIALPYGVASAFFQDELDNYKAQDYRARYIIALREASKCVPTVVADVYKGE